MVDEKKEEARIIINKFSYQMLVVKPKREAFKNCPRRRPHGNNSLREIKLRQPNSIYQDNDRGTVL